MESGLVSITQAHCGGREPRPPSPQSQILKDALPINPLSYRFLHGRTSGGPDTSPHSYHVATAAGSPHPKGISCWHQIPIFIEKTKIVDQTEILFGHKSLPRTNFSPSLQSLPTRYQISPTRYSPHFPSLPSVEGIDVQYVPEDTWKYFVDWSVCPLLGSFATWSPNVNRYGEPIQPLPQQVSMLPSKSCDSRLLDLVRELQRPSWYLWTTRSDR